MSGSNARARLMRSLGERRGKFSLGLILVLLSPATLVYFLYRNWPTISSYDWTFDYRYLVVALRFYVLAFDISVRG